MKQIHQIKKRALSISALVLFWIAGCTNLPIPTGNNQQPIVAGSSAPNDDTGNTSQTGNSNTSQPTPRVPTEGTLINDEFFREFIPSYAEGMTWEYCPSNSDGRISYDSHARQILSIDGDTFTYKEFGFNIGNTPQLSTSISTGSIARIYSADSYGSVALGEGYHLEIRSFYSNGQEDISVPAGIFKGAAKISNSTTDGIRTLSSTIWFAPEIGVIKSDYHFVDTDKKSDFYSGNELKKFYQNGGYTPPEPIPMNFASTLSALDSNPNSSLTATTSVTLSVNSSQTSVNCKLSTSRNISEGSLKIDRYFIRKGNITENGPIVKTIESDNPNAGYMFNLAEGRTTTTYLILDWSASDTTEPFSSELLRDLRAGILFVEVEIEGLKLRGQLLSK